MGIQKPELLIPAGDAERLESALNFGADAVYLGGKSFGMRAGPANFSAEELAQAVVRCHAKGVKLYLTCNTLPHNAELADLPEFLRFSAAAGVDAFIVADLGVLALAKKHAPQVPVHISTQAGVINYETARAFHTLGAERVVLARELSFAEIAEIRAKTPQALEIEAFVHGAMCLSFSGRCLLSSYMTGRDANRGDCAQPCRWEYELIEKKRPNERFPIEESAGNSYILNSRDMCLIQYVPELIACGISSLKVEGRAKSAYYVASVTKAYRSGVDFAVAHPGEALPRWIVEEVEKISHREYSTGFYLGTEPGQTTQTGGYIREWDVVAISEGRQGEYLRLSQRGRFFKGDVANVLPPVGAPFDLVLDELFDKGENPITVAPHAVMTVLVKTQVDVPPGAYLRVSRNKEHAPIGI